MKSQVTQLDDLPCGRRNPALRASAVGKLAFFAPDDLVRDRLLHLRIGDLDRLAGAFCAYRVGLALLHRRFVVHGTALFPDAAVTAALPAETGPLGHLFLDGLVVCPDVCQEHVPAVLKGCGVTDVLTSGVDAFMDRLCEVRGLVLQPDRERRGGHDNRFSAFKQPADMSAARRRHERLAVFV